VRDNDPDRPSSKLLSRFACAQNAQFQHVLLVPISCSWCNNSLLFSEIEGDKVIARNILDVQRSSDHKIVSL
jgi:hypothetical protein